MSEETHTFDLSRQVEKKRRWRSCFSNEVFPSGWAFEKLIHGGEFLQEVTHLVLDEVHERSIDADLLHLLLKLVLPSLPANKRPKVVLMSATFNAGIFSTYYCPKDPPQPLYVGAKRYSVTSYFLEQVNKREREKESESFFFRKDMQRMKD